MGYGGVIIVHFLKRNGLIILGNSYDNIGWGLGKIRVKKMSPTIVFNRKIGFGTAKNKPSKAWQMFANVSAFGKKNHLKDAKSKFWISLLGFAAKMHCRCENAVFIAKVHFSRCSRRRAFGMMSLDDRNRSSGRLADRRNHEKIETRQALLFVSKRGRVKSKGGQRPVALPEHTALAPGGLDAALICHVAGEMHLLCTIQKESTV